MSEDFRKQWFCERILTFFMENDQKLLNAALNLDGDEVNDRFDIFLNADDNVTLEDIRQRVFTAYKTFYSTIVDEELAVDEEVHPLPNIVSQLEEKKKDRKGKSKKKGKKVEKIETEEKDADDELVDESRSSKRKKKIQKKGGRISSYTMMNNILPDDRADRQTISSISPIKKSIQKVVELPQIQCIYGSTVKGELESVACCVYFIKKNNRRIPLYKDIQEANANMSAHFYVGSLGGDFIEDLELTLKSAFLPLFQNYKLATEFSIHVKTYDNVSRTAATRKKPSSNFVNVKRGKYIGRKVLPVATGCTVPTTNIDFDFTDEFKSLTRILKWASIELKGEKQLSINIPDEIQVFLKQSDQSNNEINQEIANSLNKWTQSLDVFISDSLQSLNFPTKNSSDQKLLAEYDFWRETEVKLATATDILDGNLVSRVMEKLQRNTDYTAIYEAIDSKKIILHRLQKQAKENANILRTHQPFFQTFISGDFKAITKIIPQYIDSLKSVWMLSKYYNEEKNMLRLLQNTKTTLCNRVKTEFEISVLFSCDWDEQNEKLRKAKKMLQTWKCSYLNTRHCIESNVHIFIRRWEFDKSTLFSETEYITNVLEDIMDILKAMKQYRNLFVSSGLCEIPDCRNECKSLQRKAELLTSPIEKADFDIYLEIFRDEWLEVLDICQQNMTEMDQHLKILIIKTFSQIKAFEERIETVKNIAKIETRPTVHDSLPYMCNKIVLHFIKQVETFDQLFEKNRKNHVVKKYKICDSTSWAENLLEILTQQMSKLKSMINTVEINVPVFTEATEYYIELEHKIRSYLSSVIETWISDITLLMKNTLTDTIIKIEKADVMSNDGENKSKFEHSSCLRAEKVATISSLNWIMKAKFTSKVRKNLNASATEKPSEKKGKDSLPKFTSGRLFAKSGYGFNMNLQREIFDVIEHFGKLNFSCTVSSNYTSNRTKTLSLTIDSLKVNMKEIENVLIKYNKIIGELKSNKITLLKEYLLEIEHAFQPGVVYLTWKYSGINDYCKRINVKCEELAFMMRQVEKTLARLDSLITNIQNINFFPIERILFSNLPFNEFIKNTNTIKRENIEKCQRYYEMISQTLIQLESLVLYTHSGKSPSMLEYYECYSEKILQALTESVLHSIENLKNLFDGHLALHFLVRCYLEKNQIKMRPTCKRIFESIKIMMIEFFTELKCLKFWIPGGAIIIRSPIGNALVEEEISKNEQIKSICSSVLKSLRKLCDEIMDSSMIWYKYSILWQYNKDDSLASFALTENSNLGRYEMIYNFYSDKEDKIDQENRVLSVYCVNINAEELIDQLKFHCNEWKTKLSAQLASDTRTIISFLSELIPKLSRFLHADINGVQDLTNVLTTINEIHEMEINVDVQLYMIEERLHELEIQSYKVDEYLIQSFVALKSSWDMLLRACSYQKLVLEPVAQQMIPEIQSRIHKFVIACQILKEEYDNEVPMINSLPFDDRLDWIRVFVKRQFELDDEQKKLQHLSNCYQVIFRKCDKFNDINEKFNFIKQEYKVFQYDV